MKAKSQSQGVFELLVISNLNQPDTISKMKHSNPLFGFYKKFISSQDGNNCGFYPSCSQFAAQAIKSNGFFIGSLAAFDRISRCNGHNHQFYLPYKNGNKRMDSYQ